ncbi:hypothetical protein GYH30_057262 [Glycine max]|nr:hypothetical protein GYH30_057262 [Glycine max]
MNKERNRLVFEHETTLDNVHASICGGSKSFTHGEDKEVVREREECGVFFSEINNLKNTFVLVKEKVLRLEISVKDTLAMAMSNTLSDLGDRLRQYPHQPPLIATRKSLISSTPPATPFASLP